MFNVNWIIGLIFGIFFLGYGNDFLEIVYATEFDVSWEEERKTFLENIKQQGIEIERLNYENSLLVERLIDLEAENIDLEAENIDLEAENIEIKAKLNRHESEMEMIKSEIEAMESLLATPVISSDFIDHEFYSEQEQCQLDDWLKEFGNNLMAVLKNEFTEECFLRMGVKDSEKVECALEKFRGINNEE